jgi:hypothetical protein
MPALGRSYLGTNKVLLSNQWLTTANGRFNVLLTDCGELQIRWGDMATNNTFVLWSRNGGRARGNYALIAQGDGNVCIYPVVNGSPVTQDCLWAAHDKALPGGDYFAEIQDDGDFALYRGDYPSYSGGQVWSAKCSLKLAQGNLFVKSQAGGENQPPITLVLSSQPPSEFRTQVATSNAHAAVSVRTKNASDRAQRWQKWEWRQDGELIALALINEKSSLALCNPESKDASVWTTDRKAEFVWWTLGATGAYGVHAIVSRVNDNVALNVAGNPPYHDGGKVLVWRWKDSIASSENLKWVFEGS